MYTEKMVGVCNVDCVLTSQEKLDETDTVDASMRDT